MNKLNLLLTSFCFFCASTALCLETKQKIENNRPTKKARTNPNDENLLRDLLKVSIVNVQTKDAPTLKPSTLWPLTFSLASHSSVLANIIEDIDDATEPIPLLNINSYTFKNLFELINVLSQKSELSLNEKKDIHIKILAKLKRYSCKDLAAVCEAEHYLNIKTIEDATSEDFSSRLLESLKDSRLNTKNTIDLKNIIASLPNPLQQKIAGVLFEKSKNLQSLASQIIKTSKKTLTGHTLPASSVYVAGNKAISTSWDKTLKIWNLDTGELIKTLHGHSEEVNSACITGNKIISASWDKTLKIWDLNTGELIKTLNGHTKAVNSVYVADNKIISTSLDKTLKIWNLNTGELIKTLHGHTKPVNSVYVADNNIISASRDKTLKIWNLNTGKLIKTLDGHSKEVNSACIADNKIISVSQDQTLKIWDLNTGKLIKTLNGHTQEVTSACITGNKIISASWDKTLKIWDLNTGELIKTLHGHCGPVFSVYISGSKIVSAAEDGTLKIWSLTTGNLIGSLHGHADWESSVSVTDDKIISAAWDNTLKIWNLSSLKFFEHNMTLEQAMLIEKLYKAHKNKTAINLSEYEKTIFNSSPKSLTDFFETSN